MPQFIAFVVSVLVALSIANMTMPSGPSEHVKIHMPRSGAAGSAGVSGGGTRRDGRRAAPG